MAEKKQDTQEIKKPIQAELEEILTETVEEPEKPELVQMLSETTLAIEQQEYEVIEDYREGFDKEKFGERFSDVLTKYDFIVGDWGFEQLRLRGFYHDDNKRVAQEQTISTLEDYLSEYCNFGCAYFVLEHTKGTPVVEKAPNNRRRGNQRPKSTKNTNANPSKPTNNRNSNSKNNTNKNKNQVQTGESRKNNATKTTKNIKQKPYIMEKRGPVSSKKTTSVEHIEHKQDFDKPKNKPQKPKFVIRKNTQEK